MFIKERYLIKYCIDKYVILKIVNLIEFKEIFCLRMFLKLYYLYFILSWVIELKIVFYSGY